VKINHALVIAGAPRIGKDTLFEPLRLGVGAANFAETSPHTIMKAEWNGYLCSVVLRVSEARDMGEVNRYALYEKMKTILAAPPPMHWIQTKYIPNYYAPNVTNTIITTNYGHDGLYLPPDDGRHYVADTEVRREDFPEGFFDDYWALSRRSGERGCLSARLRSVAVQPEGAAAQDRGLLGHGRCWSSTGGQRAERHHRSIRPPRNAAGGAQRRYPLRTGGADAGDAAGPGRRQR
jgi:hypothetical protein